MSEYEHLRARELSDRLRSLRDGVLGEFTGKHETDGGLDFTTAERCLLVVCGELTSFGSNTLKNIVDEGVHNGHALLGDTCVRVNLLQDLVDVRTVCFRTLLGFGAGGGLLRRLGGLLGGCLGHLDECCSKRYFYQFCVIRCCGRECLPCRTCLNCTRQA
jgi:hypothetical protein